MRSTRWLCRRQGLLEVHRFWPNERLLDTVRRLADLRLKTFGQGGKSLAGMRECEGSSATVLLDPIMELFKATNDSWYLNFAETIVDQMGDRRTLDIVHNSLKWLDLAEFADGKIYQLIWKHVGILKLHQVTGNPDYLQAVLNGWDEIVRYHLTIGGGPWGGFGGKWHECFNTRGFWTPYGIVETCSTMSWIQLNRELLRMFGDAKYADEVERAAYNSLLGAQFPNGEDWSYYTLPNGFRELTGTWACCASSGPMALEELGPIMYGVTPRGVSINLYGDNHGSFILPGNTKLKVTQRTDYPFAGRVILRLEPEHPVELALSVRIPSWADEVGLTVNGSPIRKTRDNQGYATVEATWREGDKVGLEFPMKLVMHRSVEQESVGKRSIYSNRWSAFTRGPLVYAVSGLIEGEGREDRLRLPYVPGDKVLAPCPSPSESKAPAFRMPLPNEREIVFLTYFEADKRVRDEWRLTWIKTS